MIILQCCEQFS